MHEFSVMNTYYKMFENLAMNISLHFQVMNTINKKLIIGKYMNRLVSTLKY